MHRILRVMCLTLVLMWGFAPEASAQADIQSLGNDETYPGEEETTVEVWCTLYAFKGGDPDDPYSSGDVEFHLTVEGHSTEAWARYSLLYGEEVTDTLSLTVPGMWYERTATCWADGDLGWAYVQFQVPATRSAPPQKPTSEITTHIGWHTSSPLRGVAKYLMHLIGPSSYTGMNVEERNVSAAGEVDSCYFSGSKFAPQLSHSGSWWPVTLGDEWGPDNVGWQETHIRYYRGKDGGRVRYPCDTRINQPMYIDMGSGWVQYRTNWLRLEIVSATQVANSRDGVRAVKTWY